MEIIEGDKHDPCGATHLGLEFARLNEALKECGVKDAKRRRKICTAYFFGSTGFLDAGYFAEDGTKVRPVIAFEELDEANRPTGKLHLPDLAGTALHEYVDGTAIWLFEDNDEDASSIEVGEVAGPE